MSSVGFGALKALVTQDIPFSELIEHGLDEHFFEGAEKQAYLFIKNFRYRHDKYPEIRTIEAEIGKDGIFDNLPIEPVEHWAGELRERKQFWLLNQLQKEISQNLHSNKVDDTVQKLSYYYDLINQTQVGFSLHDLKEEQQKVIDRHNEVQLNPGISGIPFGFPALDELTYGNQIGDFNTVVGITGACKSYVCLKSVLSAYLQGYNVIFISPEMPSEQIARRLLALQANLKEKDIRKGKLSYYAIQKAMNTIAKPVIVDNKEQDNYFKILPSGLYSDVNSIISVCSEYKPDFLCIDGFYLLNNSKIRTNSAWREDESVIFALKNFSIHSKIPILASTQYNRSKPGKLEGARSSQSVEQISSNFFSLEFENQEDRDTMRPIQTRLLKVKKSRDGDSAIIRLKLNFNKMTIEQDAVLSGYEPQEEPEYQDDKYMEEI